MSSFPGSLFIAPASLPPDGYGFFQLVFLMVVYGVILSYSANLISDGSELLLFIPCLASIVGSVILPIIGQAPEGAIMVFSGLGPDAQTQISVGVGALAGSTIMLLTVPWTLVLVAGRVSIVGGKPNYRGRPKLKEEGKWSPLKVGVAPYKSVANNARLLVVTSIAYWIIQGAAFGAHCDWTSSGTSGGSDCIQDREHWFALAGLVVAIALLVGYLVYNIRYGDGEEKDEDEAESHLVSLSLAFDKEMGSLHNSEQARLLSTEEAGGHLQRTLRSYFKKYDANFDGLIDRDELQQLLDDFGQPKDAAFVSGLLGSREALNFEQFSTAMETLVKHAMIKRRESLESASDTESQPLEGDDDVADDDDDDAGDDDDDEDNASQPKWKILARASWMIGLGTIGCLLFSDPMVDCFSELAVRLDIKPFYVAFVLAPIASNVQEIIASTNYAVKKTRKSITISLVQLEGSVCMNNTFCLGIFLALMFFRGLTWEFSAETISIIFVEVVMALVCTFRRVQTLFDAACILSLFPISLAIVWILENVVGLN